MLVDLGFKVLSLLWELYGGYTLNQVPAPLMQGPSYVVCKFARVAWGLFFVKLPAFKHLVVLPLKSVN